MGANDEDLGKPMAEARTESKITLRSYKVHNSYLATFARAQCLFAEIHFCSSSSGYFRGRRLKIWPLVCFPRNRPRWSFGWKQKFEATGSRCLECLTQCQPSPVSCRNKRNKNQSSTVFKKSGLNQFWCPTFRFEKENQFFEWSPLNCFGVKKPKLLWSKINVSVDSPQHHSSHQS